MLTDIEIAQSASLLPIQQIAQRLGVEEEELEPYGRYKAKLSPAVMKRLSGKPDGKLILVTAINPTPAGEGKTTTTVGLGEAMAKLQKNTVIALREPSLGPVFGIKGGAAGGGYAQAVPMEDINLHFTGDMHAITAANNLLCACIDNHLQQGNELSIDPRRIILKRCMDMNDRALRHCIVGLGGKVNGVPREDSFQITVASEVMAILCLADDLADLKKRLGRILVAYKYDNSPVYADDLGVTGSMAALLKDAIKPNLVQTLENTPVLMHGGPFANIAHGCNSVLATKLALKYADYVVTEAGFGADLGAEKFIDIKCRMAGLKPAAVVLVATIRALKMHGGVAKADLATENVQAVIDGLPNLDKHLANIQEVYGLPVVVAINKFPLDTEAELEAVYESCKKRNVDVVISDVWAHGGAGGRDLAEKVIQLAQEENHFSYVYDEEDSIETKLTKIVTKVYGGKGISLTPAAKRELKELEALGFSNYPICMAKTQYSFSDDAKKMGAPKDFTVKISNLKVAAGAGFIVALTGTIMTMPGLPKVPASEKIDIDAHGNITGLF